ncbi:MAG TPA: hypothetical protein ENI07_12125 [Desulfobacterales bacterium]|nr:hypothetical protein [Desulfobacterales bacterium]
MTGFYLSPRYHLPELPQYHFPKLRGTAGRAESTEAQSFFYWDTHPAVKYASLSFGIAQGTADLVDDHGLFFGFSQSRKLLGEKKSSLWDISTEHLAMKITYKKVKSGFDCWC